MIIEVFWDTRLLENSRNFATKVRVRLKRFYGTLIGKGIVMFILYGVITVNRLICVFILSCVLWVFRRMGVSW